MALNQNSYTILIAFAIYLLFMLLIGWYFYKRTQSVDDYILAGRGLNSWVASLSAQASDMSGWLMMGLPGYAYAVGLEATWIAVGLFVGTYLNWRFVALRLRLETEKYKAITLPVFFENKFNDNKHIIRTLASIFIIIFFLIYTSSGFVAGAKLFNAIFHISYHKALLITATIIIAYTFMGGFNAVSWTDFFQGILMFISIIAVPLAAIIIIGGCLEVKNELVTNYPAHLHFFSKDYNSNTKWIVTLSNLAWGLGYFGQPHILARFMAIKRPELIKRSRRIALSWVFFSLFASLFAGVVGRVYFTEGLKDPESVFLMLANVNFPPLIAGIMLAAILAAVMSTADSQLLVTSSSVSEDIYKMLSSRKKIVDNRLLVISRIALIAVAIVSVGIAWEPDNSVLGLVSYAWAGFGAAFGPLILLALYWPRMTRQGAIAAIVSGGITVLIWNQLKGGLFDLYEIIPAFFFSTFSGIVVSKFTRKN